MFEHSELRSVSIPLYNYWIPSCKKELQPELYEEWKSRAKEFKSKK
jgi:hypothetical protein